MTTKTPLQFVVCIKNKGYEASLEPRKIYQVLPDEEAESYKMIRVVDESGEDYLFPVSLFSPIVLPVALARELALSSSFLDGIINQKKRHLSVQIRESAIESVDD